MAQRREIAKTDFAFAKVVGDRGEQITHIIDYRSSQSPCGKGHLGSRIRQTFRLCLVERPFDAVNFFTGRKAAAGKALAVSVETVADGTSMPLTVEGILKH